MIIARKEELIWLERQIAWSHVAAIIGIRGVGKSKLLHEFLEMKGQSYCWVPIESDKIDCLLSKIETHSVENRQIVFVWDGIENINSENLQRFLAIINHQKSSAQHFLISSEELAAKEFLSIPKLMVKPLSKEESREYVAKFSGIQLTENETEQMFSTTAGIPSLLNLWIQAPCEPDQMLKQIVARLGKTEESFLYSACVYGKSFTNEEIASLMGMNSESYSSSIYILHRSLLVEKIPGENTIYRVPNHLREAILQNLPMGKRVAIEKKVLAQLLKYQDKNNLDLFLRANRANEFHLANQLLLNLAPDNIDPVHKNHQDELLTILTNPIYQSDRKAISLRMRALYLRNRRDEALNLARNSINIALKIECADDIILALETVRTIIRSGENRYAARLIEKLLLTCPKNLNAILLLEKANSILELRPNEAKEILELEVIPKLAKDSEYFAYALFHLARVLDRLGKLDEALNLYKEAAALLASFGKTSTALAAKLNSAWILLAKGESATLESCIQNLKIEANNFGLTYIEAGIAAIEAKIAFNDLEMDRAIERSDHALVLLGKSTSQAARLDVEALRLRALLELGNPRLVRQKIKSLKEQAKNDTAFIRELNAIEFEASFPELTAEEIISLNEQLPSSTRNPEAIRICLYRRSLANMLPPDLEINNETKALTLARLEGETLNLLNSGDNEEAWFVLRKIEEHLSSLSISRIERAAIYLLRAEQSTDIEEKKSWLDRAETQLSIVSKDDDVTLPLKIWLESIRKNKLRSPEQDPRWQGVFPGEKERWGKWWQPFYRNRVRRYLVTQDGDLNILDEIPLPRGDGLEINTDYAETRWNGEAIKELESKPQLRALLSAVLEANDPGAEKSFLAMLIWGEEYKPNLHDARIYSSVQRLRSLLNLPDAIENFRGLYRWNPKYPYRIVSRERPLISNAGKRVRSLLLRAIESANKSGRHWTTRSELTKMTGSSESTVKREVSQLINEGVIHRRGNGRSVQYRLKRSI